MGYGIKTRFGEVVLFKEGITAEYGASLDWTDLIPIDFLFNEECVDDGLSLINRVTRLAQNEAYVLYPSISATNSASVGLNFSVTLDTALRVNKNLLMRSDIQESELTFRTELNALLESKLAIAH